MSNYKIIYETPDGKDNFVAEVHKSLVHLNGKTPTERLAFVLGEAQPFFDAIDKLLVDSPSMVRLPMYSAFSNLLMESAIALCIKENCHEHHPLLDLCSIDADEVAPLIMEIVRGKK